MRGAAFRLAQPIGAKSANDKSNLKGTRPCEGRIGATRQLVEGAKGGLPSGVELIVLGVE